MEALNPHRVGFVFCVCSGFENSCCPPGSWQAAPTENGRVCLLRGRCVVARPGPPGAAFLPRKPALGGMTESCAGLGHRMRPPVAGRLGVFPCYPPRGADLTLVPGFALQNQEGPLPAGQAAPVASRRLRGQLWGVTSPHPSRERALHSTCPWGAARLRAGPAQISPVSLSQSNVCGCLRGNRRKRGRK